MPPSRIPRFVMPDLILPLLPVPSLPPPGTRLSVTAVCDLYDRLMEVGARCAFLAICLEDAFNAHYAQHGRTAPPMPRPGTRRPARRRNPDTGPTPPEGV